MIELFPYIEAHEMDWRPPDTLECEYCDALVKVLADGNLVIISKGDDNVEHCYIPEALYLINEPID